MAEDGKPRQDGREPRTSVGWPEEGDPFLTVPLAGWGRPGARALGLETAGARVNMFSGSQ